MNTNYEAPQIEVIEIEVEDVLCASGFSIETTSTGSTFGSGAARSF